MKDPTPKQEAILDFVKDFSRKHATAPSFREIADHFNVSVGTAQDQLNSLQKLGRLTWTPGRARSIQVTSGNNVHITRPVPLLGVISAGEGIRVSEEPDPDIMNVPATMLASGFGHYCLRVSGFSMAEDGILDGDIIVVRQQATATDGDAVVAIIKDSGDEKATLKRFYHHGDQIELRPRNQQLTSRFFRPELIEVRGKFCGLIRQNI